MDTTKTLVGKFLRAHVEIVETRFQHVSDVRGDSVVRSIAFRKRFHAYSDSPCT